MRRLTAAVSAVIAVSLSAALSVPANASVGTPRLEAGDCLTVTDLTSITSASQKVGCDLSHNAEVFGIGTAPNSVGLPSKAFLTLQQMNGICAPSPTTTALAAYLDHLGIAGATIPNRAYMSVLLPTDDEWKAGTRAVSCIVGVVADSVDTSLVVQSWTDTAAQKTASEGAGWLLACSSAQPTSGTTPLSVACQTSAWAQVDPGVRVSGTAVNPYPGSSLQSAADDACRSVAQAWTAVPLRSTLQFAAALPPEDAWTAGVHTASCWIPFAAWSGAVTLVSPIPADAAVTVVGPTAAFAGATTKYGVRAANADDTGLAHLLVTVTVRGNATFGGGGTTRVISTDGDGNVSVPVAVGKSGSFTLSAALVDAPAVSGTLAVTIGASPMPKAITITGKKTTISKKKGVVISGVASGFAAGTSVTPYFKISGQKKFTKAKAVRVSTAGTVTWKKITSKPITVYVQAGKTKSNQITVKP